MVYLYPYYALNCRCDQSKLKRKIRFYVSNEIIQMIVPNPFDVTVAATMKLSIPESLAATTKLSSPESRC